MNLKNGGSLDTERPHKTDGSIAQTLLLNDVKMLNTSKQQSS